ncbi:transcription initiation protein [Clavibacter sp. Sh2126]|uniref:transcription initiation protein n=1 Tax=Clavibacter sp. Sh2126 TaxID=3397678 RepID=UPI0039DF354B
MTKWLISFPSGEMDVPDGEWQAVVEESHAVVREAKAEGVWVFGGGIDGTVPPVRVAADGSVSPGAHPGTGRLEGGYAVLDLPTRESAYAWAARMAAACRCAQEVRAFGDDPES